MSEVAIGILKRSERSSTRQEAPDEMVPPPTKSTGLRAFMTIGKIMKTAGGHMVPCGLSGLALEIYTSSGFAQVFPPAETLDDARRMLGG